MITKAGDAQKNTEVANEKEITQIAVLSARTEGEINKVNLEKELNIKPGIGKYTIEEVVDGIVVIFNGGGTYLVDDNGEVIEYTMIYPEPTPEESSIENLLTMLYGVIEIEFLGGTEYETTSIPNEPILKDGMKAVYWVDNEGNVNANNPQSNINPVFENSDTFNKSNWYEYIEQTAINDGKTSRWANAVTQDGSYYVWIPRYAYRIIYFDSEESKNAYKEGTLKEEDALEAGNIVGYSDARGIVDSEGKRPKNVTSTTEISVNEKYFRTHPVFDGNTNKGGWDSKLTGIWVMKYEASRDDANETEVGVGIIPKSVPNVKSWGNTNISMMFSYARDAYNKNGKLNTILNSHIMKNNEWGAIAYLADSKYGRNGTEISLNQCSNYITGAGRGLNQEENSELTGTSSFFNEMYQWANVTDIQKYNGVIGQLSSTTGNIYGVYDITGGTYEYVMGFYQDDNGNIRTGTTSVDCGFNGYLSDETQKEDGIEFPISEKKYYQLYQKTSSNGNDLGDAIYETPRWYSDNYKFVNSSNIVFRRGGGYQVPGSAGAFYCSRATGAAYEYNGFRVCLAVK